MSVEQPLDAAATIARLSHILASVKIVGFDSEGQAWPTCLGFADSPTSIVVVDTLKLKGHPQASEIWSLCRAILESPAIAKWCWNAAHERAFLELALGWRLRNYDDAMLSWHEIFPELPHGLKYAASLLTRLPCWTTGISWREDDADRPAASGRTLWVYNAFDCASTLAIAQHATLALTGVACARYTRNLALIEPFNYASQKGILYDTQAAAAIRQTLTTRLWEAQARVDEAAGIVTPKGDALLAHIRDNCCAKRKRSNVCDLATAETYALKDFAGPIRRVREIHGANRFDAAAMGEICSLLGIGLNVKSTKAVTATLNALGLPPVFKRKARSAAHDTGEGEQAQTKNAEALLALYLRTAHPITTALLETIALRDRIERELDGRKLDSDGRMRSSFSVVGPSSDRTASHKWLSGGGGNAQNIPKEPINFRVCYTADPGFTWFKLDLTGADLWTVACHLAREGDPTMLDDLRGGVRIPSLVGLMLEHGYRPGSDRVVIKADCAAYRAALKAADESWKDTVWKKASHLTNYGGSPKRIRLSTIKDTYKDSGTPIDPGLELCQRVQRLYLARYYGLPKWWARTAATVVRTGKLEYASGRIREFLYRRPRGGCLDDETRREALAAEPQANTTNVILEGVYRLWHDADNWASGAVGEGDPYVQPLLPTVHDECSGQFPSERRAWAADKLKAWFTIPITIAGMTITMPFDAAVGPNWGACKEPL